MLTSCLLTSARTAGSGKRYTLIGPLSYKVRPLRLLQALLQDADSSPLLLSLRPFVLLGLPRAPSAPARKVASIELTRTSVSTNPSLLLPLPHLLYKSRLGP